MQFSYFNFKKRLPDAEYEIMNIIWEYEPPLSTNDIIGYLKPSKTWKSQTVLTLLARLTDRGFISSEKTGKERYFRPLIERSTYVEFETKQFVNKFYKNSIMKFINSFYNGQKVSQEELDELRKWMDENEN